MYSNNNVPSIYLKMILVLNYYKFNFEFFKKHFFFLSPNTENFFITKKNQFVSRVQLSFMLG